MREAQVCTPLTEGTQGGPGDLRIIVQMASGKSGFTSRQLGSRVHPLNHCRGQPPTKAALQWVSQCYGVSPGAMEAHGGGGTVWEGQRSLLAGGVLGKTWSYS